ncbi:hypothetical protein CHUAL_009551 [Chamberlinius hualienensis]
MTTSSDAQGKEIYCPGDFGSQKLLLLKKKLQVLLDQLQSMGEMWKKAESDAYPFFTANEGKTALKVQQQLNLNYIWMELELKTQVSDAKIVPHTPQPSGTGGDNFILTLKLNLHDRMSLPGSLNSVEHRIDSLAVTAASVPHPSGFVLHTASELGNILPASVSVNVSTRNKHYHFEHLKLSRFNGTLGTFLPWWNVFEAHVHRNSEINDIWTSYFS